MESRDWSSDVCSSDLFPSHDNRDSSDDSRYWGMIPLTHLESKVFLIWLSLDWLAGSSGDKGSPSGPRIRVDRLWQRVR